MYINEAIKSQQLVLNILDELIIYENINYQRSIFNIDIKIQGPFNNFHYKVKIENTKIINFEIKSYPLGIQNHIK